MYKLNGKEVMCLATIARRTRNRYLEKNKYTYLEDEIDMLDENIFVAPENVEEEIELKYDREICANEIEKVFKDPRRVKSIKTLTEQEKLVFYLRCFEGKTDEEIGGKLNKSADAIRKTRGRAKDKSIKKFNKIKEEENNDF